MQHHICASAIWKFLSSTKYTSSSSLLISDSTASPPFKITRKMQVLKTDQTSLRVYFPSYILICFNIENRLRREKAVVEAGACLDVGFLSTERPFERDIS